MSNCLFCTAIKPIKAFFTDKIEKRIQLKTVIWGLIFLNLNTGNGRLKAMSFRSKLYIKNPFKTHIFSFYKRMNIL